MEALHLRIALCASILGSLGAGYRTQNFIVTASTQQLAREIGDAAERFRDELAVEWLGHKLPPWPQPCPITAQVDSRLGAGGATSFMFGSRPVVSGRIGRQGEVPQTAILGGRPYGWEMSIQGSRQRVLDSVLPHEVTHTIFATHFGRPLPRWADEGACTTVEHQSERKKQEHLLYQFLTTNRGIAFNRMFAMTEYPPDILPLYSQGYSLARYLIAQGGKQKYVRYIGDGMATNNWTAATQRHYGFKNLSQLQLTWLDWVRHGYPPVGPNREAGGKTMLADATTNQPKTDQNRELTRSEPGRDETVAVPTPPANPRSGLVGAVPPAQAAVDHGASWYAQHRDRAKTLPANSLVDLPSSPPAMVNIVPTSGTPNVPFRSASRPQPTQGARQVVLEWGRPGPFFTPSLSGPPQTARR